MKKLLREILFFNIVMFIFLSCGTEDQERQRTLQSLSQTPISTRAIEDAVNQVDLNTLDGEVLWSLSTAEFADAFGKSYLTSQAVMNGSLPQVLQPNVRKGILQNEKLKTLLRIADVLGNTGSILVDLFANDSELAKYIREAAGEIIAKTQKISFRLDRSLAFNLDAFSSPFLKEPGNIVASDKFSVSFSMREQAAKWAYIFNRPKLWQKIEDNTILQVEPSLELLHLFRTLMEWNYLFGIDSNTDGKSLGGMTVSIETAMQPAESDNELSKFDPRQAYSLARCLTGNYTVSYPNKSYFDLAVSGGETWSNKREQLDIDEQVKIWTAAAIAFKKLRPKNRPTHLALFGGDNPLPESSHFLAFAFLPSMEALLNGPFIDASERTIKQYACINCDQDVPSVKASLRSHVRLLKALSLWAKELSDINDIEGLDETVMVQLKAAPNQLIRAIQLGVQNVFRDFAKSVVLPDGRNALMLIDNETVVGSEITPIIDVAAAAEAAIVLQELESELLHSEWLKSRVVAVHSWLLNDVFLKMASESSEGQKVSAKDVFWFFQALKSYKNVKSEDRGEGDTLNKVLSILEQIISNWDRKFLG